MTVYLDHAATTPIAPAAIEAMAEAARQWANPSSVHADGRRVKAMLEDARERVAAGLGCRAGELVFTSGGTEALELGLRGAGRVLASAVEHDAVRRVLANAPLLQGRGWGGERPLAEGVAFDARVPPHPNPSPEGEGRCGVIPVDRCGIVEVGAIEAGALVVVQHANNETGVIQPVETVVEAARAAGARTLVDAVQTAGKMDLPPGDLVAVSAHKLGGPPGVGALVVRDFDSLMPLGGQERGYRGGTENVPAIMGFAAAVDVLSRDWLGRARALRDRLEARLGVSANGAGAERLPNIGSIRMAGVPAATQVIAFDMAGFRVSAGAACSSGKVAVSHVLTAMGVEGPGEAVRVSLGPRTTEAEIDAFAEAWEALAARRVAA